MSEATVLANGADSTDVAVTVRDAYDNLIPGLNVALSGTGAGNIFLPGAGGNTSPAGTFGAAWSSTVTGVKTLTAAFGSIQLRAMVTFVPATCGTLRFSAAPSQVTGTDPLTLTAADLTADGRPDVVAANCNSGDLTVSINRGDGGFSSSRYDLGSGAASFPVAVAAGAIDGDPWMDLAVSGLNANLVWLLYGNGDGGFVRLNLAVPNQPTGVGLADLNGDLAPDLLVTQRSAGTVSVYLNQRDAGWALGPGSPVLVGAGGQPGILTTGDFNGDGVPNMAGVNTATSGVFVLRGDRDGGLGSLQSYSMTGGSGPTYVLAADLRDAGVLDLVVTQNNANNIAILLGNGDGTFRPQVAVNAGRGPAGIAVGDLDGDLRPDLAVENLEDNNWTPLLNSCF